MQTFYSDIHRQHHGRTELYAGTLVPCFEMPSRADMVLERVRATALGEVLPPRSHGLDPVLAVHDAGYVTFLQSAWQRWQALGRDYDALPKMWQIRRMRQAVPEHVEGQLCYYSMDCGTPITAGTWPAICAAADVALSGADALLAGQRAAFALTRPPGHHAARDYCGGYCFFNNAAIAAQHLRQNGARRVAVLDVDYHHGNGTQDIFYRRSDVLFLSIHGHPRTEYPFFLGFADECGEGEGLDYNVNYPLAAGSDVDSWFAALELACGRIGRFAPDALVISLGVDAFVGDPISKFALQSEDFLRLGERLGRLGIPALFCLEGGYAVEPIGMNAVNVLTAFESSI
ncbi:acetylpolyamine amidohydrolase AphB [Paludibacterium sp. THUN1379]|uniref:histone deacetylase family protein n=1 Tax=Paludibacterium sp. THUN1379 TaxID=3112107 RepID=UPI003087A501|nr:acetylpolyamine amidohydrolase AphB [Paludibacterium sp. THUN1379]